MRILLIEDEERIANFIKRGLKENKFSVDVAKDGEEGLYLIDINSYNLIILDLMLPKVDGLGVCKHIRQKGIKTPVLILTARSQVNDRVRGLDAGADDYLPKPFAFTELLARIRALLRRPADVTQDNVFRVDDLHLNLLTHEVRRGPKVIPLTAKEFSILEYFMRHSGEVITRTMISENVWNEDFHSLTNVIDVHIRYLRRKIDEGHKKKFIHTLRGVGYVLKG